METKEKEEQKENLEGENQENPEEEKEEEEEPVDIELQKEMKGLKISDSDFTNKPNTKKTNKKFKNPDDKKTKKKGQDFLDYANKNNIQINLEYEENKYQFKKNQNQKFGDKNGNKYYEKKPFNKGEYKNENRQPQKQKYSGNKFDNYGQRQPQQNYYQRPAPKLVENNEILEYLEKLFSEENLNKDTYIRNRLKEDKILLNEVTAYNDIKRNNIDSQKIKDIIKDSKNLECVNEDNKDYIKIKNFDKLKLFTIEEIIQNKKAMRMPKMPYMPMGGQQFYPPPPYIAMQNNYFITNQPIYGNPNSFYPYYPVEINNK